jgi:hypothetical protein
MAVEPFVLQGGLTGARAFGITIELCYTDSLDSATGTGGV